MDNLDLYFETLNGAVEESLGYYHQVCADTITASAEALEIFEVENMCILAEAGYARISGSQDGNQNDNWKGDASEKQKGAAKKLLSKIVEILRKGCAKLADAGKYIVTKLKGMLDALSGKVKKLTQSKALGGKPWPNGFSINFVNGNKELSNLCDTVREVSSTMNKNISDFAMDIVKNDMEKAKKFIENPFNKDLMFGGKKHPRELLNDNGMRVKIPDGDNSIMEWATKVYQFEQHGEDFAMSIGDQMKMMQDILRGLQDYSGILDFTRETAQLSSTNLRKAADTVEKCARVIESGNGVNMKFASGLHSLSSMMVTTSEYGIHSTTAVFNFGVNKINQAINKFIEFGLFKAPNDQKNAATA